MEIENTKIEITFNLFSNDGYILFGLKNFIQLIKTNQRRNVSYNTNTVFLFLHQSSAFRGFYNLWLLATSHDFIDKDWTKTKVCLLILQSLWDYQWCLIVCVCVCAYNSEAPPIVPQVSGKPCNLPEVEGPEPTGMCPPHHETNLSAFSSGHNYGRQRSPMSHKPNTWV